jgi:cytochrome P450
MRETSLDASTLQTAGQENRSGAHADASEKMGASMSNYVSANRDLDHIPGDDGLPFFGNTLYALFDSLGLFKKKHRLYGQVYRGRVFYFRQVTLVGPEGAQLVLQDRTKNFSSFLGWYPNLGRLFPNSLVLQDFDEHRLHRKRLLSSFRRSALQAYINGMSEVITSDIKDWHRAADFRFYPLTKELLLKVAVTVFLGVRVEDKLGTIHKAISNMAEAATAVSRLPIPGTKFWKGIKGRRYLTEFILGQIPEKRAAEGKDMLAQLCSTRDEDGVQLTDQQIVDQMMFIIMASHDTVTSAGSSLVCLLAQNPQWQEKVREEIANVGNPDPQLEEIDGLQTLDLVFKEALRLYPPVPAIPRRCIRQFEFGGYTIPANTAVWVLPLLNHRLQQWWSDPDTFNPARFSPEHGEDKRHPYSWTPFGGGAHTCIGLHLGGLIVKTLMYHLLRRYAVALPGNYAPRFRMLPFPKPQDGLRLILRKI